MACDYWYPSFYILFTNNFDFYWKALRDTNPLHKIINKYSLVKCVGRSYGLMSLHLCNPRSAGVFVVTAGKEIYCVALLFLTECKCNF